MNDKYEVRVTTSCVDVQEILTLITRILEGGWTITGIEYDKQAKEGAT
jgi:hypothetical protein